MMHCMPCNRKSQGKDHKAVIPSQGRYALKAYCERCGTQMFKYIKRERYKEIKRFEGE